MAKPVKSILIVGGGASGWLTAAYLAAKLGASRPDGVQIRLIESSDIPLVGVGEGTFPTIKKLLTALNQTEEAFLKGCSGTFKQGIQFVDWTKPPEGGVHSHYYHPFNLPNPTGGLDLLPYWLMGVAGDIPFSQAVTFQDLVCDHRLAPKKIDGDEWFGPMNYAYHFDAGKLAHYLSEVGQQAGVKRIIDTVERANLAEDGSIASVTTTKGGDLEAELFVDCTGFRGTLIGQALGSPYHDVGDVLFVDRALAMQVPYDRPDHPIASTTISTAHEAGWTWDIGLVERRGVGYVYSSAHTTDDRAAEILRGYLGKDAVGKDGGDLPMLPIKFRSGYRPKPWVKNCVAVGLAGGFLEPLESTGIVMISAAAEMIGDFLPATADRFEPAAKVFNEAMVQRYERAVDFVKLHYCLSGRRDTEFWKENVALESWTDRLVDKVDMWKDRLPSHYDISSTHESFGLASWRFILCGMGFRTNIEGRKGAYGRVEEAADAFRRVAQMNQAILRELPTHRAVIDEVNATGFRRKGAPAPRPVMAGA